MKAKHIVSVLMFGLIIYTQASVSYSQNPTDPQKFSFNFRKSPTFGLKGGILMSTITGDEAIDRYAKKSGPQIGFTGAVYFHPMLSLRGELNYESKGGKFANHEMNMNLHYATLPVYLKFNFTRDPELYIYGGGYGSYLISANTKGTYEIIIKDDFKSVAINENITASMNNFDAGIIAGLGVQGRFNRQIDIFLDFRYTWGLINLDNNTAEFRYNFNHEQFWPEQNVTKPKNQAFMLTTGFIIYLIRR
ncbi:MAG: PorT family protein [Bacteroidales bacterium]|nr:PorT family protein [Bacteroidales bacterium]